MVKRLKRLKKIRIHREGTDQLTAGALFIVLGTLLLWSLHATLTIWPAVAFFIIFGTLYAGVINFYQCPIRYLNVEDTEGVVVAPCDGKVVVIEDVMEDKYFHDKRKQISIFMSPFNVHANWFPCDGKIKHVEHFDGNYHKAWLPKASSENEHADIIITTEDGDDVLCRQIAGAMARRIVTYAKEGEECYIDEHLGFIKLGSRVDIFLPVDAEVKVKMGQKTVGDLTVLAQLKKHAAAPEAQA